MKAARITGRALPWMVLAPLIAAAGAAFGYWWRTPVDHFAASVAPPAVLERVTGVPSFAGIVAGAKDAVVGIRTIHRPDAARPPDAEPASDADPPVENGLTGARPGDGVSQGTGFVLHRDGLVLTAHHLVAEPSLIVVQLPGIGTCEAELIGEDPVTDIALLRLNEPRSALRGLRLGRSEEVLQGDWVVTIGNPLRLRHTVVAGVVGFVGRHIDPDEYGITNEHLQFGAPAYPGSSGSPVLDARGDVVGMTTRSVVDGDGFSFAVTSRVIRNVLASMSRHGGRVKRAHFGAAVELARGGPRLGAHRCAERLAVELVQVAKDRPAHRAGLRDGDVVVELAGHPIDSLEDFYDTLTWADPGTEVRMLVARGEQPPRSYSVQLGELGRPAHELTQ